MADMVDGPGATKCPRCGHADHFAGRCFNMQSDNDCNCTFGDPPPPIPIRGEPADVPREMRHPAAADVGWQPFPQAQRLNHIALGDIIDTLSATGFELRVQIRNKADRE